MAPLMPDREITGSNALVPFGGLLDPEDRRRETAALATALDPQGDGATVHWENVKSGHKGSITAAGRAYPSDGKICRGFAGTLDGTGTKRSIAGVACAVAAGDWTVLHASSVKT